MAFETSTKKGSFQKPLPPPSFTFDFFYAQLYDGGIKLYIDGAAGVAQWLEQGFHKAKVAGSNPAAGTEYIYIERLMS